MSFGTPVPLLLGIILVLSAVALFFLDRLKPGYQRDADKVYALLFLFAGIVLLTEWDMSLWASFQQLILVGTLLTLMVQNIYSRTPRDPRTAQPVGGYDGGRDDYRPSRPAPYPPGARTNVRAELDRRDYVPEDRYYQNRPMLGGRDEAYYDDYRGAPVDTYNGYRPGAPSNGPIGRLPGDSPARSERGGRSSRPDSRDRTYDRPNDRPSDRPVDRYDQPPSSYSQPSDSYSRPPANSDRWSDSSVARSSSQYSGSLPNRPSSLGDSRRSQPPARTASRFDAHDPGAVNQDEPMAPSNYVDYSAVNPEDRPDRPLNLS